MTILFAGGEMGAFIPADSNATEWAQSGKFNSSFARCALSVSGHVGVSYAESASFTETAGFWLHFDTIQATYNTAEATLLSFYDSGGTERVRMRNTNAAGGVTWKMQYWNGTAWTNAGSTLTTDATTSMQTVDINIVSDSASGSIKVYLSGTERIDSGTVDLSSFSGISKFRLLTPTSSAQISQVIAADEPTIGWRLTTAPATGVGATTDWTGGYTEIDEIVYSDADFINSATANQVELFSHSTTVPAGYTVRGVAVTARAKCGASGPQNIQLALRSAGTTYFSSSKALDAGYGAFVNVWETDPATTADFTASAIAALQFGVKSIT